MDERIRRAPDQNGRELHALCALLIWVACFEVAPFLHTSFHGRVGGHTHHVSGAVIVHDHAPAGADSAVGADGTHGAHDLLHRGVVTTVPGPAVPPVPCAPRVRLPHAPDTHEVTPAAPVVVARARAPPAPHS